MLITLCISFVVTVSCESGDRKLIETVEKSLPSIDQNSMQPVENGNHTNLKNYNMSNSSIANSRMKDEIPNYVPTGFHDFVSSDQGPTFSYETTSNTPRFDAYQPYYGYSPYRPEWNSMYRFYTTSYRYPLPEDRLPHDYRYRMANPYHWHLSDSNAYNYPVPEDRLPPIPSYRSLRHYDSEKVDSQNAPNAPKSRKARFIKNFLENKSKNFMSKWGWNGGSDMDNMSPENIPPEFYMLMNSVKNTVDRSDQFMDDDSSGNGLSTFLNDPVAIMVAIFLPLSMMLAAVLPVITGVMMSNANNNGNIPLVTTTATGNSGKTLEKKQFLAPLMDAIGTFSPRSDDDCIMKAFCKVVKKKEPVSEVLQKAIFEASTYVDEFLLNSFGFKTLMESLKDGECERIECLKRNTVKDVFSENPKEVAHE